MAPSTEALALSAGISIVPAQVQNIPERLLRPSSVRQPRSTNFDVSDLLPSMGNSAIGLIHPIWVRTRKLDPPDAELGDHVYEIVVGERRSLAARQLGWSTIRAEVHDELSNLDVFMVQLVENDARRNLSPFEQADAVAKLMAPPEDEGFGITDVVEIAARLQISTTVAYQRIALAQATRGVRDAYYGNRLHLGSAIAIASLHDPAVQDEAVAECVPLPNEEPFPVRRVQRIVQDKYHLRLSTAPFDTNDRTLVPTAPTCSSCPKRAGSAAQQSLFNVGDAALPPADDERCTDRRCFLVKRAAWRDRKVGEHKAKGLKIIDGNEGADMFPAGRFLQSKATGLVALDDKPSGGGGKTYRELLGDAAQAEAVAVDADDRVHELMDKGKVRTALDGKVSPAAAPGPASPLLPEKASKSKEKPSTAPVPEKADDGYVMQRKAEEIGATDAVTEMVKMASKRKATAQWWRFVLRGLLTLLGASGDRLEQLIERRQWRSIDDKGKTDLEVVLESLAALDEEECQGLMTELVATMDGMHPGDNDQHGLAIACRFYKIDLGELVGAHAKRLKAEAKKAAVKGKPEAEAKADLKAAQPAKKPRAASAKTATGECTACECTDKTPCQTAAGDDCVWFDVECTLCSVCGTLQAMAQEILEQGDRSPTLEEIANMIRDRLEESDGTTRERIKAAVGDAVTRGKVLVDKISGRLRARGVRVIDKDPDAGATPSAEPTAKEAIIAHLRAATGQKAKRQELLKVLKDLPASVVLRAVAALTTEKLVRTNGPADPIELIAPTFEEAFEGLDGLKLPELKSRYAHVFNAQAPQLGVVDIKKRIAARLSGEQGPKQTVPTMPSNG